MNNRHTFQIGETPVSFEVGKFALQADGAVLVRYDDIVLHATAHMGSAREGMDFFPLVVDFEPKYYATGKIKGSRFNKREGRPSDNSVLVCRLIDRPLRPMFPKGTLNEVQINVSLLQSSGERSAAAMAITAASMAVQASGIPIEAPVSGVRVGMDDAGEFFLQPTFSQIESGKLDLIVAGTEEAITMVEAGASLVDSETLLRALEWAHEHIKTQCRAQAEFRSQLEITEKTTTTAPEISAENLDRVDSVLSSADFLAIKGTTKKEIKTQLQLAEQKLAERYEDDEEIDFSQVKKAFEKRFAQSLRARVFDQGERLDGRAVDQVRPLSSEVQLFERLHGCALFQRGETQAFSVATLAGPKAAQIIDDPDQPEYESHYFHHYNFPGYSVGEVKMNRGVSRREIGHGALAERALRYVMPTKEDGFPYTVRVVSEIFTCNGSSSMASVCGSTLALMDAGVPIKAPIAGVAMGLLMNEDGDYRILTDIQSFEDFDGDMDFKIAGNTEGITALQLDIKVKGLKIDLLRQAIHQAQGALQQILETMGQAIAAPREKLSAYAPRILQTKINPDFIGAVIGKGGEVVQDLCKTHNCEIDIQDDGTILITGTDAAGAEAAQKAVETIAYEPKMGDIFEDATVKSIKEFGAFVEYLPGKEALVHISEISDQRVNQVSDHLTEGQRVRVKYVGNDKMGRVRLSMNI